MVTEPGSGFVCLVCGHGRGRRQLTKQALHLHRCLDCGFVQMHPLPAQAALDSHYRSESAYGEMLMWDEPLFATRDRQLCATLAELGAAGPLVDVGAGAGLILQAAVERGWQAIGVELSEHNAALIRRRVEVPVHLGHLEDVPILPGSVGVVTLSHTLEHLRDPVGTLRRARELLRPGGILFIAVPNWAAVARMVAAEHTAWINPEHIGYFDRQSLGLALGRAGLMPIAFDSRPFLGVGYEFALALIQRFRQEPAIQRFLHLGDRPLLSLMSNDVQLTCPAWRFRLMLRYAHLLLALWPERLFCALGRGQELRGFARRAG